MANIEIDFSELLGFRDKLLDSNQRDKLMRDATRSTGEFFREEVETNTPVETGELRESWSRDNPLVVVRTGSTYEIEHENEAYNPSGKGAYYASFVEDGHYSVAGNWVKKQEFMANAEAETERNSQKIFDKEFQKWKRWVESGS